MHGNPVMDEHMDSFDTQQQQRQRKGAVDGVGRLNTSTVYSTIGRFIIHWCSIIGSLACWDCPLLLCPMNSELTSHDPWYCLFLACIMCYQALCVLCVVCNVLRGGGAWCVVRGGLFSCASSPAELWPLSNLPGRVFDGVRCTHHT